MVSISFQMFSDVLWCGCCGISQSSGDLGLNRLILRTTQAVQEYNTLDDIKCLYSEYMLYSIADSCHHYSQQLTGGTLDFQDFLDK